MPVFNPNTNYKLIWDLVQLFFGFAFLFYIPIHIIYGITFQHLMGSFIAILGPIMLTINNLLYLNLGIYNKGVLIINRKLIFL